MQQVGDAVEVRQETTKQWGVPFVIVKQALLSHFFRLMTIRFFLRSAESARDSSPDGRQVIFDSLYTPLPSILWRQQEGPLRRYEERVVVS